MVPYGAPQPTELSLVVPTLCWTTEEGYAGKKIQCHFLAAVTVPVQGQCLDSQDGWDGLDISFQLGCCAQTAEEPLASCGLCRWELPGGGFSWCCSPG